MSLRLESRIWVWMLAFLWVFLVFVLFFSAVPAGSSVPDSFSNLSRFPIGNAQTRWAVWEHCLSSLLIGFLCLGGTWGSGRWIRMWLGLRVASQAVVFSLEVGLGIGASVFLWMGLGLNRLWYPGIWTGSLCFLTLFFISGILKKTDTFRKNDVGFEVVSGPCILLCGSYFLFLLLHAFLPETFYDSLNYFLGLPQFWSYQHGIADDPAHLLSGYFHAGSLFFAQALFLGDTQGAKVLNVLVLSVLALSVGAWVKEWVPDKVEGNRAGWLATTVALTFPLLYLNFWAVRVDGLLTFLLVMFTYSIFRMWEKGKVVLPWCVASGLLAGTSIAVKPTAFILIVTVFLVILVRERAAFFKNKAVWIFSMTVVLCVGPWLLKNEIFAGNPFFPYAHWLGGRSFPAQGYDRLLHENQQFLPVHSLWDVINLPWRMTLPQYGDGQFIGPLLLAFLPLLFLLKVGDRHLSTLIWAASISLMGSLCLSHMLRFSMPSIMLLFIAMSVAFFQSETKTWKWLWIGGVLISGVLCFPQYLELSARFYDGIGIWSGREKPDAYLERMEPNSYEPLVEWVDSNLPQDARLLVVGDARGLYYPRTFYANSVFDEPFFAQAARQGENPEGIGQKLREWGIDYVLFNIPEGIRTSKEYQLYNLSPEGFRRLDAFMGRGLVPVYWKDSLAIYQVLPGPMVHSKAQWVDPFSFFCPAAYDYADDARATNTVRTLSDIQRIEDLFPNEGFWKSREEEWEHHLDRKKG